MKKPDTPVTKRSLMSWVLPGNLKLQAAVVLIISLTVFTRVLPLEMQKRIVNEAIRLKNLDLLYLYCGIYVAAVLLSTGLKYIISLIQTVISQRVLANMRKEVYHHTLTLPLNFFRKTQPGMIVSSLVTELTTAGDFAGMAIAVPVINVLTLLSFGAYLFTLNWVLAVISLSIYPMVLVIVPLLQRKANQANKKRVDETRALSSQISDTITGIHEVHGNGSYHIENRKFDRLVDRLFRIRMIWTLYKQGVNTTNNFFTGLSPFLIFLLGGYLAMKGQLELGALVAFLSAQEKLYDPWRELIDFYQVYQDAAVRYSRTMEYFDTQPEFAIQPEGRPPYDLTASVAVENLSFETEDGIRLLDNINFTLKPGEHLALVGFSGSGKSTLAQCVGQQYKYTGGHVKLGEVEVMDMTKMDVVSNVGYVAQNPFIFDGTIEENLLYACASLVDGSGGAPGRALPDLDHIIEVLQQTGVFVDVLRFGLNAILDPRRHHDLIERLIRVRDEFREDFGRDLADYVEFFDPDRYLVFSNVAENLVFGTPTREAWQEQNLSRNPAFLEFLDKADLTRPLLSLGGEVSKQAVDILGNLPPDKVFYEQSPILPEELEDFRAIVEHLKKLHLHQLGEEDRFRLLGLALRFVPGQHKMVSLPGILRQLLLEGRSIFRERIAQEDPAAVTFFNQEKYIFSQTILNNILFGKLKTARVEAQEKINQSIIQLLIDQDLLEAVVAIGMQFRVGSKGERLSGGQRQKLAIARAFLKSPRILIMDEATSALDNRSQARIQNQLETRWKGRTTLIAVVHRLDITKNYDKIAVMKAGNIIEMGTYEELIAKKGMLYELASGRQ